MKFSALFVLSGLLVFGLLTTAEARPVRFTPHHHSVVVKRVVVNQAPRHPVVTTYRNVRTVLPAGFIQIYREGKPYYYYEGIYFIKSVDGFTEVPPLASIRMASLPEGYVSVRVGRESLYRVNDVYYRLENGFYIVV